MIFFMATCSATAAPVDRQSVGLWGQKNWGLSFTPRKGHWIFIPLYRTLKSSSSSSSSSRVAGAVASLAMTPATGACAFFVAGYSVSPLSAFPLHNYTLLSMAYNHLATVPPMHGQQLKFPS